ncbi:hypothetical protein AGLY_009152 [Aphis glycines]|uniref:Anaphase-promoting complex subunit 10 n=1 Tax=Aphis glycines TaxID=307491 RepID=A0A6G0TKN9_APHGL|nr:hypothetical protein AGLY_009152 [Aphis glycines]
MLSQDESEKDSSPPRIYCSIDQMKDIRAGKECEVGSKATWSVSSWIPGHGVRLLSGNNKNTYWKSCGTFPHLVNIQFRNETVISHVYIYVDYALDKCYTPSIISIRTGSNFDDLEEYKLIELVRRRYWIKIRIPDLLKINLLQIAVLKTNDDCDDCIIRLIKIHSPTSKFYRTYNILKLWR